MRMSRRYAPPLVFAVAALSMAPPNRLAGQGPDVAKTLLARPILEPGQTLRDLQKFIDDRIPPLPKVESKEAWSKESERLRREVLEKVVLRGEAKAWSTAPCKVVWLDVLDGPGYKIKKVRYEAIPGMWIPALLYEPTGLTGKTPATLNVMGHDRGGKDVAYQQIRCINLAKRGMLALNVEWFAFGQLTAKEFNHGSMNQLDLCGTSGLAPFYLSLKRGLDVLLSHPNADPQRVAVSGLSGGGWQTIFISALDTRVTLANPVAGYSSFRTRIRHHKDLGDSEQTPSDLATIADYDHLTAMMAPRATLLTYNAKDECCFESGYALPPLLEAAGPYFGIFNRQRALHWHVNQVPGTHNYEKDNREAFYRMIGEHFYPDDKSFRAAEIPCDKEVKNKQELLVPLPEKQATFHSVALALAGSLPKKSETTDKGKELRRLLRARDYAVKASLVSKEDKDGIHAEAWRLRLDNDWTAPVRLLSPATPKRTVLVLRDAPNVDLSQFAGDRMILLDPLQFGENRVGQRDYLWSLTVATVGERPLGIQASQVAATARWLVKQKLGPVVLAAHGPRSSLVALAAAGIERDAIAELELRGGLKSLKEVIEQNKTAVDMAEVFCFGLLGQFDVPQLVEMAAPRKVRMD